MIISKCRLYLVLNAVTKVSFRYVSALAAVDRNETYEIEHLRSWKEIPGPSSLPLIGTMHHFLPGGVYHNVNGVALAKKLYDTYGPIIRLEGIIGRDSQIFLYDAEGGEQILRNENAFPLRPGLESLEYYRRYVKQDAKKGRPTGVITDKDDEWRELRSVISPVLLMPKTIQLYTPALDRIAKEMIARLESQIDENYRLKPQFDSEMSLWALESTGVVALGYRLGCLDPNLPEDALPRQLINCAHEEFKLVEKLDYSPTLWRCFQTPNFRRAMMLYGLQDSISKQVINKAMKEFKNKNNPDDEKSVLEKLMQINEEYAVKMVSDMMFSGIDSIANTLTATLYLLASNPDKQTKLREELQSDNSKIPYLKACLKESMRLLPISIGTRRVTTKEHHVLGYRIPPNTYITVGQQFMSLLEEHFHRSDEYLPERWLVKDGDDPLNHRHAHPFAHAPFGYGVRSCAARRIASLILELFTARMVERFQIEWSGPPPRIQKNLINYVKGPFNFVFKDAPKR